MLDDICKHGLVEHTLHLIGLNSRTTLSQPTYIVSKVFLFLKYKPIFVRELWFFSILCFVNEKVHDLVGRA